MNTLPKKLILVDAMALIYRAHFAFINNPRLTAKGLNTSAVFGFVNSLIDILDKEKPTHAGVAFDSYEPTVRHTDFTEYKANRDKQPEDISIAIPYIKEILKGMKIPVLEVPGYEADDIIATISSSLPEDEFLVYMFTPDKDYAQLVKKNVFLYKPAKKNTEAEIWDEAKVCEEFGIKRVEQVVDIQGLMGDAVDNIPGIPGIGPKTAQKLIEEFDSVENLIKNADKLSGNVAEKVKNFSENAIISKRLATLIRDVPLEFHSSDFERKPVDTSMLEPIFAELEFRTLGKRLLGKEPEIKTPSLFEFQNEIKPADAFESISDLYIQVDETGLYDIFDKLINLPLLAVYPEYSAQENRTQAIKSLSFCSEKGKAVFYKFPRNTIEADKILENIRIRLESFQGKIAGYDLKQFLLALKTTGKMVHFGMFDVMIAHYLLDPEGNHELEPMVENHLGKRFSNPGHLDTGELFKLNCQKADYLFNLSGILNKKLENQGTLELFTELESPLIEVLAEMEFTGVKVSPEIMKDYSAELSTEIQAMESKVLKECGISFNLNSPQQLGRVLFEILKLDPKAKKTQKTKQYSTSEDVLSKLAEKHPVAADILEYRSLQKLKSTYADALPNLIRPVTGRVHTTFNQAVTATGRLSSTNPNLQNIPIRTDRGRYLRKGFIADGNEHILLSADYSQIELRIMAHYCRDEKMIEAFRNDLDIHTSTAASIYNVAIGSVTPEMRRKAKMVNFGIIYGISSWGLSQRLEISKTEGSDIIKEYFLKFPGIKNYMDSTLEFAREKGYVETLLKRRRYIRDINSRNAMQRGFAERNAINAPVQGSAADMIKIAMVRIFDEFRKRKLRTEMILQVHDELLFEVYLPETNEVKLIVKEMMENALPLEVPVKVEIGTGQNWLEAH